MASLGSHSIAEIFATEERPEWALLHHTCGYDHIKENKNIKKFYLESDITFQSILWDDLDF